METGETAPFLLLEKP